MVRSHSVTRHVRRLPSGALALMLLALYLGLPGSVHYAAASQAAQGTPRLAATVRAGFGDDGSYIIGAWFPVRVSLVNPAGAPSSRVRVEVESTGGNGQPLLSYAREVDLPSPARKEITLYALSASYNHMVQVRIISGSTVLATAQANINPLDQANTALIGVASSDGALLNVLSQGKVGHTATPFLNSVPYRPGPGGPGTGSSTKASVAHITLADLPAQSPALDSLWALVLEDVDTGSLSAEQRDALTAWVARGGTLVVALRPGGAYTGAGLEDLLPVKAGGTRNLESLASLADLVSTPITITGSTLVTAAAPRFEAPVYARVLAVEDDVPLVAERDLGQGRVTYLAVSPAVRPLRNWDGLVPLFTRLLADRETGSTFDPIAGSGYAYPGYYGPSAGVFDVSGDMFDLPGLDLPSGWLLAAFMLAYIMLIGPVNFIVLRRIRRTELAWATIPALVVLFSVGAYVLGYNAKGGDIVMPSNSITYTGQENVPANSVQMWGLFSPLRRTYTLQVGAESLIRQFERYNYGPSPNSSTLPRVTGGETTSLENVVVDTGGLQAFVSRNATKADGPLEANLRVGDGVIEGTIRNRAGYSLQDVAVIRGDAVSHTGYMAAGATAPVRLLVSTLPFDNNSPASVLPPPQGITAPGGGYPSYSSSGRPEEREYFRKLSVLSLALQPVLTNDPPRDMDVLVAAWGGDSPVAVSVAAHTARIEDTNLWISRFSASGGAQTRFSGTVPYWTYAAGAADSTGGIFGPPTDPLKPYADINFRLGPGTTPQNMSLVYDIGTQNVPEVDWLAYNTKMGSWDRLAGLMDAPVSSNVSPPPPVSTPADYPWPVESRIAIPTPVTTASQGQTEARVLALPSPGDYVGPAGNMTLRLAARSGTPMLQFHRLNLFVNESP